MKIIMVAKRNAIFQGRRNREAAQTNISIVFKRIYFLRVSLKYLRLWAVAFVYCYWLAVLNMIAKILILLIYNKCPLNSPSVSLNSPNCTNTPSIKV